MDFTLGTYEILLNSLINQGFSFFTVENFTKAPSGKVIVLRQDVDALPDNSLQFARIQADKGIRGTYYFRIVPESFDEKIIKEICLLGHEVGYHYEDVSLVAKRQKAEGGRQRSGSMVRRYDGITDEEELVKLAIGSFQENLDRLRKIAPVNTICMHGSPLSRWDSRLLWKYYDYHDFGITGEPYFDVDFEEVLYLTDTGRRWNGESVSVRDKARGSGRGAQGENPFADWKVKPFKYREETGGKKDEETKRLRDEETKKSSSVTVEPSDHCTVAPSHHRTIAPFPKFHSTSNIIKAAGTGRLPDRIMMTFHPQRWTDKPLPWVKELVWQNVKNVVKYFLVKSR